MVDVLPNGPQDFVTVQVFLAGGVPEVMLRLRELDALDLGAMTVTGKTVGENLDAWEGSERRERFKQVLREKDGVDPDDVIWPLDKAAGQGRTLAFLEGNLAPQGAVVKSTAIRAELFGDDGVYRHEGAARVFTTEGEAISAVKSTGDDRVKPGEVLVLLGRGPLGAGMPETAQITSALKYTEALAGNALITDGRFSGFSSGPCIGHVGPEALAGGPLGKLQDGDIVRIEIARDDCSGRIDFVGDEEEFAARDAHPQLEPDPALPDSVRLWAALQETGGGTWGGCLADVEEAVRRLKVL
jgi:dihydroxyacid dehydratase/phosphogluconate dehydratase